jgi:hypothetical protein
MSVQRERRLEAWRRLEVISAYAGWGGGDGGIVCRVEGRQYTAANLGRAGRSYPNPEVTQFQSRKLVGTVAHRTRRRRLKLLVAQDILKRQPPFFYE